MFRNNLSASFYGALQTEDLDQLIVERLSNAHVASLKAVIMDETFKSLEFVYYSQKNFETLSLNIFNKENGALRFIFNDRKGKSVSYTIEDIAPTIADFKKLLAMIMCAREEVENLPSTKELINLKIQQANDLLNQFLLITRESLSSSPSKTLFEKISQIFVEELVKLTKLYLQNKSDTDQNNINNRTFTPKP